MSLARGQPAPETPNGSMSPQAFQFLASPKKPVTGIGAATEKSSTSAPELQSETSRVLHRSASDGAPLAARPVAASLPLETLLWFDAIRWRRDCFALAAESHPRPTPWVDQASAAGGGAISLLSLRLADSDVEKTYVIRWGEASLRVVPGRPAPRLQAPTAGSHFAFEADRLGPAPPGASRCSESPTSLPKS